MASTPYTFTDVVRKLSSDLNDIDLAALAKDLRAADKMDNEREVYDLVAKACAEKNLINPQWGLLAGRLMSEYIRKITPPTFSASTALIKKHLDPDYAKFVEEHAEELNNMIVPERDYGFDSFAVATARYSYLAKTENEHNETILAETMQYMYLRVATYMWKPDMQHIKYTYDEMSLGKYTPASPTLFNSGKQRSQLASCFLLATSDNMQSIAKGWHDAAIISMNSGGMSFDYSQLRHSKIAGTGGESQGILPWLKIKNEILQSVNQGGMRKGSATIDLRIFHVDIEEFIEARKGGGAENMRARDLFYCLVVDDLFMRRVKEDKEYSLFCPNRAKGLFKTWGLEFENLYIQYENKGYAARKVRARDLWQKALLAEIELGMPFILYVDAANRKNNQRNKGYLGQSNLCMEIIEFTSDEEIASCNLSSIALNSCVVVPTNGEKPYFDYRQLTKLVRHIIRNLNQVIDRNYYPADVPQIKYANFKNRPTGLGVQGLADAFAMLDIPWVVRDANNKLITNPEASKLNHDIFETMYYAAVRESVEMAKETSPYDSFDGSPASKGLFQFDLWDIEKMEKEALNKPLDGSTDLLKMVTQKKERNSRYTVEEWESLRSDMIKYGRRNSLLIALMPTASSASILGNNEAFEPFTQNIYARTVLSGQHIIVNRHMVKDLQTIGLWTTETVRNIVKNNGSVQELPAHPDPQINARLEHLKLKYMTAFEIPQRVTLQLMLERGRFVCQSQSFNCFMKDPTYEKLNAFHFAAWEGGAITGMYYLRQPPAVNPINVSLDSLVITTPAESAAPKTTKVSPSGKVYTCDDHTCCT